MNPIIGQVLGKIYNDDNIYYLFSMNIFRHSAYYYILCKNIRRP